MGLLVAGCPCGYSISMSPGPDTDLAKAMKELERDVRQSHSCNHPRRKR